MALIIKGDMPNCCAVCWECNCADDGNFCAVNGNRLGNDWQVHRMGNCPILGEIPDDHGRLVDADIMKEAFEATALIEASRDKGNELIYFDRIELVHGIIDRTPTILEAST